jgi:hypothetical protein
MLFVVLLVTCPAVAQDLEPPVEERYLPFQGTWKLVAASDGSVSPNAVIPDVLVEITGNKISVREGVRPKIAFPLYFVIPARDEEKPYRWMANGGRRNIEAIADIENQIVVFWFVGIYKLDKGVLELRLKYAGQGSDFEAYRGETARNATLPGSFSSEVTDGEIQIVLERFGKPRVIDESGAPKLLNTPSLESRCEAKCRRLRMCRRFTRCRQVLSRISAMMSAKRASRVGVGGFSQDSQSRQPPDLGRSSRIEAVSTTNATPDPRHEC